MYFGIVTSAFSLPQQKMLKFEGCTDIFWWRFEFSSYSASSMEVLILERLSTTKSSKFSLKMDLMVASCLLILWSLLFISDFRYMLKHEPHLNEPKWVKTTWSEPKSSSFITKACWTTYHVLKPSWKEPKNILKSTISFMRPVSPKFNFNENYHSE